MRMRDRISHLLAAGRCLAAVAVLGVAIALLAALACDDPIEPRPPKNGNLAPESFLVVSADSL